VIAAGGGPDAFKTTTLLSALAGASANVEVAKLVKLYGAADIKQFMTVSDFVVADGMRVGRTHGIALPPRSDTDSVDGHVIVAQLHAAGSGAPGKPLVVEHMLDELVSRPLRMHIMRDVVAKYGRAAAQSYLEIVALVVDDLDIASASSVRALACVRAPRVRGFDRTSHVG
jgi:hypothetical protein